MNDRLEVKNLHVSYGEKEVLTGIDFSAGQGMTVILGQNGCGKTTLFRAMTGAVKPREGEVLYNGASLFLCSAKQRAKMISCMNQRPSVSHGLRVIDVAEMSLYPKYGMFYRLNSEDKQKIEKMSELLDIDNILYEQYDEISVGQAQLAALLSVLVQDTPVVLADEPNSALDYNNTRMVLALLRNLAKISIVVLHDPTLAIQYADRILLMSEGRIITEINPEHESTEDIKCKLNLVYGGIQVIFHDGEIFCK